MKFLKYTVFVFTLAVLAFPWYQETFGLFHEKSLKGDFKPAPVPIFCYKDWFNTDYQESYRKYTEDSIGFKNELVRLFNQVDYSLFSLAHSSDAQVGKNGNFCMLGYMKSYLGLGFKGYHYIEDKAWKMRFIQDYLVKKNILFLVIFPPEKANLYPENMPDRFQGQKKEISNYDYYAEMCNKYGVNLIDFNRLFRMMKDTSRYLLIPPTGTHWSDYGSFIAADSLIRYIESKMKVALPHLIVDSISLSRIPQNAEDDIIKTMNLIWKVKYPVFAHCKYHVEYDSSKPKLSALFVGDSFYWGWYDQGIIKSIFSNEAFYYYDNSLYPQSFKKTVRTIDLDLRKEVEEKNLVIVIQVCGGSGDMGAGFVDRAYTEFDTSSSNEVRSYEVLIRKDAKYMALLRQKAVKKNLTLDQMIRAEAIHKVNSDLMKLK